MTARDQLRAIYMEWRNDYLSLATYAEHHGLTEAQAADLITLARDIFNTDHPEA